MKVINLNEQQKEKPLLKGSRDSYLVVGGVIPCAFYDEESKEWWLMDEKKQNYKCDNTLLGQPAIVNDLHIFESPEFRPFYNDEQFKNYCEFHNLYQLNY